MMLALITQNEFDITGKNQCQMSIENTRYENCFKFTSEICEILDKYYESKAKDDFLKILNPEFGTIINNSLSSFRDHLTDFDPSQLSILNTLMDLVQSNYFTSISSLLEVFD